MPNTRGLVLEGDPWPSYFNPFSFTNCAKSVFGWVSSKNHLYSDLGLGRAHPNFPQRNPSRLILALLRFQTEPFQTWKQKQNKQIQIAFPLDVYTQIFQIAFQLDFPPRNLSRHGNKLNYCRVSSVAVLKFKSPQSKFKTTFIIYYESYIIL